MEKSLCVLCDEPILSLAFQSELKQFCCHGCQAVYKILESHNALNQKKDHPILQEAIRHGLISNPALLKKKSNQETSIKKKWIFEITNMWCPSCADFITLVLCQQNGVLRISVDYVTDLAAIDFDPRVIDKEKIKKLIESLSYSINEIQDKKDNQEHSKLTLQFAVAAFAALNVMMFAYPLYTTYFSLDNEAIRPLLAWISLILTIPVITYSGLALFKRCIVQARQFILGMEALLSIGISAAMILSLYEMWKGTFHIYFDTVTVLIAFLLLGKIIESKAKFSTKQALKQLQCSLPRKGRKCFKDQNRFVPLKEVVIGDELLAYTGEKIVLDGIVVDGEGACDESVMTGESIPLLKKPADLVLAGAILQSGQLRYRVTSKNEESTLHHIVRLIENEVGNKAVYVRSADRVIKWFAPLVLCIAFFTFMGTFLFLGSFLEAFSRSMAVLLIACPCAIGIAAPLIESKMIHEFTKKGALVRNRALLANMAKLTHFVFDKTGTITEGQFTVISGLKTLEEEEKSSLKGLVCRSLHPIAKAIDSELICSIASHLKVIEIAGRGLKSESYLLGSLRFMQEMGVDVEKPFIDDTVVYFAAQKKLISCITLGDQIKEDAYMLLSSLEKYKRILLSGDHKEAVQKIAKVLPFDDQHAEQSPLEKQQIVAQLKKSGAVVAMIGDGINDAPALAKADVGISVISATDISIQVSDLLLTSKQLNVIPDLINLVQKGQRLISQNLFWAFFYNVVGIVLAVFGVLTPLFASFAMITSSLIVLLNAKRI